MIIFMKKVFIFSILVIALCFAVLTPVMALNLGGELLGDTAKQAGYDEKTDSFTLSANIGSFIKIALSFVGVIFLALMVYAGFLWLTARGESEPVEKAGKIIKTAVIGFIITVGAYSITNFVVPKVLEKTTGVETTGPTGSGSPETVTCCQYCDGSATLMGGCNGQQMKQRVGAKVYCDNICKTGSKTGCTIGPSMINDCPETATAVQ